MYESLRNLSEYVINRHENGKIDFTLCARLLLGAVAIGAAMYVSSQSRDNRLENYSQPTTIERVQK